MKTIREEQNRIEELIASIESDEAYKQIMTDSFGGIMYDVANKDKYNVEDLKKIYDSVEPYELQSMGGIMKGALHFVFES